MLPGKNNRQRAWSKDLQIISLSTSVDVIRVPKARTSGKYLPINISFISICLRSVEKSHLN